MKKIYCIILIFSFVLTAVAATETVSIGIGLDTAAISVIWDSTVQARIMLDLRLYPVFGIRIPFTLVSEKNKSSEVLIDSGIFLDYLPWEKGPFISVSLIQAAALTGKQVPENSWFFLNEVELGWEYRFLKDSWYIRPSLVIRDPAGVYETDYETIREYLPGYRKFRCSLVVGWCGIKIPAFVQEQ